MNSVMFNCKVVVKQNRVILMIFVLCFLDFFLKLKNFLMICAEELVVNKCNSNINIRKRERKSRMKIKYIKKSCTKRAKMSKVNA